MSEHRPPLTLRKAARIAGAIWLALVAAAGITFLESGLFANVRVLMYALIAAALPGVLLFHWASVGTRKIPGRVDPLKPKAPFDRAAEVGHRLRIDAKPRA